MTTPDLPVPPTGPDSKPSFTSASDLADALHCTKRAVQLRAARENWPQRHVGNRIEYAVEIDRTPACQNATHRVLFVAAASESTRARALERQAVVEHCNGLISAGTPKEQALIQTVVHFAQGGTVFSTRSLRRWMDGFAAHGLDGLVDQKQGRVGRRPAAAAMPQVFKDRGMAMAIEHGSIARAARHLMRDPSLPADVREHLHEGHASKSYVTPSIRRALTAAPLTVSRIQGPRTARLASRWTPGDYSNTRAGDVFTSDDMTSNVMAWCEWPNARGWRLGQPQILPILDVRSLRWLVVRVIMRDTGAYTGDDIAGLFGDVFDTFGLPERGMVLEGGIWDGGAVKGQRTGVTDDDRVGGLASLGIKIWRSYDPRSKIIEGQFNQLQFEADRFVGFVGREQRVDLPELVKKQRALCDAGKAHPAEYFPHITQLSDHLQAVMGRLNHERQDGQLLRGQSPLELWAEHSPRLRRIPDQARWLYRSQMSIVKVTRNGVRITHGSGSKLEAYYYDSPELLTPRQGHRVIVYWDDKRPDADAILLDAATRHFIGVAQRVQPLDRFGASDDELGAEAARKRVAAQYARTEMRRIQPELARGLRPVPMDGVTADTGSRIAAAAERADAVAAERLEVRGAVRRAGLDSSDIEAATAIQPDDRRPAADLDAEADDFSRLFANDFPTGNSDPTATEKAVHLVGQCPDSPDSCEPRGDRS